MAEVPGSPYQPVFTGEVPERRTVFQTPNVPAAAFGTDVARAIATFGGDVKQAGEDVFRGAMDWRKMQMEMGVRDAATAYMNSRSAVQEQFIAAQGANASPEAAAALRAEHDKERIAQRNQVQQQFGLRGASEFDAQTAAFNRSMTIEALRHSAAETRKAQDSSVDANIAATLNRIGTARNDNEFIDFLKAVPDKVREKAAIRGLGQAWIDETIDHYNGLAWSAHLHKIGFNDPASATELLEANKDAMRGTTQDGMSYYEKMAEWLQRRDLYVGTRNDADRIFSSSTYYQALRVAEGTTGKNFLTIKAPGTTAQGLGQITKGTWNEIRAGHPDLQLPPTVAQANETQQNAAVEALTSDNQRKLTEAGISINNQNTYMAHLLGAEGAIRFLNGMAANPNAPAYSLVSPEAVIHNRSLFRNADGTSKTAAEMYQRATAPFAGGPGPLTRDNAGEWLESAMDKVTQMSEGKPPGYYENLRSQVEGRYNTFMKISEAKDVNLRNNLEGTILGAGREQQPITDRQQIFDDPVIYAQFNALPAGMQNSLLNIVDRNAREGAAETQENTQYFWRLMGMAEQAKHNPAIRDEFNHMDFAPLFDTFTKAHVNDLYRARVGVQNHWDGRIDSLEKASRIESYVRTVRSLLDDAGIFESATNRAANNRYIAFLGPFVARVEQFEKENPGVAPDRKWLNTTTQELLLDTNPGWFLSGPPRYELKDAVVPTDRAAIIQKYFEREMATTRKLLPEEMATLYQRYLTDPELRKRLGITAR